MSYRMTSIAWVLYVDLNRAIVHLANDRLLIDTLEKKREQCKNEKKDKDRHIQQNISYCPGKVSNLDTCDLRERCDHLSQQNLILTKRISEIKSRWNKVRVQKVLTSMDEMASMLMPIMNGEDSSLDNINQLELLRHFGETLNVN